MAVALVHFSLLSPDLQTKGATARPFQAPRLLHKASGVILEMQQSHKRIGSSFPFTLYLRVWRERPARHGDPECLPCSAPTASSFSRNNQAAEQHTRPTEDQTGWRSSWGGGEGAGAVASAPVSAPALRWVCSRVNRPVASRGEGLGSSPNPRTRPCNARRAV